jgi:hypothetical protein
MGRDLGVVIKRWLVPAAAVIGLAVLAIVLGLRTAATRRDCNRMLASPSSVSVKVDSPGSTVAELCVNEECQSADRVEVSSDPGVYSFSATVVSADGALTMRSGEVTTFQVEPNGEGCGTRAYGQVVIDERGTVVTVIPRATSQGDDPPEPRRVVTAGVTQARR